MGYNWDQQDLVESTVLQVEAPAMNKQISLCGIFGKKKRGNHMTMRLLRKLHKNTLKVTIVQVPAKR
jgi:hypothetical protein